ncbi:U-box domain-containing protein 33-like isoform X1 [Oryza brachyantha]|uniref:U-box domain-containing protein 33-like isoform X1 n=1 Tax=Oryza brachyantha TaxID=4533 RepID=UPI001ADBC4F3|nr:U-box domain-containing protein 33-like isoform X1 [Oryza brachyantha]
MEAVEEEEEHEEEEEEAVYCAVGKEAGKEWRANLLWVLANFRRSRRLVFVHVHRPPSRVNMMGAWVPVSQLAEEEVNAYRQLEEEKISKVLDDLLDICKSQKPGLLTSCKNSQVNASKIIFSCDDTAGGLLQLVDDHGITELVMGAASDKSYSRRMRAPRSKKAQKLQLKASPSCKIWFVCKGNLICTREVNEGLNRTGSSTTSTSPRSSTSDYSRSKSSPRAHSISSEPPFSIQDSAEPTTSSVDQTPIREDNAMDRSTEGFNHHEAVAVASSSAVPVSENVETVQRSAGAASVQSLQEIEEDSPTPSGHGSEDAGDLGDAAYDKLKDAVIEAENLRHEAYEETRRRQKAERDLAAATRIANDAESSHQREARHRKEVEERLARERAAMEQERRELDDILEQTRKVDARAAELELQIAGSERMMSDLKSKLSESYGLLHQLRRDNPAAAAAEATDGGQRTTFLRLGLSELEEATNHFDESVMIGGDGSRGTVYRGDLRNMTVAVKVISRDVAVDELGFCSEVEAISRARHPNLVTLVGACPEARAVVYEFVPGGSLEDRLALAGEGAAPPLSWHALCGVAHRTCSALAFLHSTQPRATVHGDVRPANILLDEECGSSKLAGVGMRRLVRDSGGVALARAAVGYVHPRHLATGEMTPERDVYALGVVLLRLVTGKPPFMAKKEARDAARRNKGWDEVVGASAGGWPVEVGREVALLGLKCCDVEEEEEDPAGARRLPRGLLDEACGVLEAAMSAAPGRSWSSLSSTSDGEGGGGGGAPSYFLCPILKEVMRDPQIAGDGFSYEAEAIREWLRSGHDTSPMTNLRLPRGELVPNRPLRDAIHEWRLRRAMRSKFAATR